MLRAAADGLMMLDAATRRAMADMARPAAGAEEGEGAPGRARQVSLSVRTPFLCLAAAVVLIPRPH